MNNRDVFILKTPAKLFIYQGQVLEAAKVLFINDLAIKTGGRRIKEKNFFELREKEKGYEGLTAMKLEGGGVG